MPRLAAPRVARALTFLFLLPWPALAAPEVTGLWTYLDHDTGNPKATIRVTEANGELLGTIVSVFPPPGAPANPPCDRCDGAMHGRPMIGLTIMRGLHLDDGVWTGGTITDTESGNTYKCNVTALPDGRHLRLRGYIGISLLGRTEVWVRAD